MKGFKATLPVIIVFFILLVCILILQKRLEGIHVDPLALRIGNILLFALTIFSITYQHRALGHKNPNVFVRSVMASTIIKMVIIAAGVLIYAKVSGPHFSKNAVMGILLMYLAYLGIEVFVVMKLNRKKDG